MLCAAVHLQFKRKVNIWFLLSYIYVFFQAVSINNFKLVYLAEAMGHGGELPELQRGFIIVGFVVVI